MFRTTSTIIAFGASLAMAMFFNAGVVNEPWNWSLIAIGVMAAVYFVSSNRTRMRVDPVTLVLLTIIGVIALLQIVPLPVDWIARLSPSRFELAQASSSITSSEPAFSTLSAVPAASLQQILTLGGYCLLFLTLCSISQARDHQWLAVWPLFVIAAFESGLGMLQTDNTSLDSAAIGTYANRDHYAGLLEMILPLALMYAVAILQRGRKRHESPAGPALRACIMFALCALIFVAIMHSLSRMGFIAALASLFVTISIALSVRGWKIESVARAPLWRRALPVVAVALIVVLGFVFLPTDPLVARFSDLAKTDDVSAETRAQIWRETLNLIKTYPLFGCGLGGFESCFMRFKTVAPMNTVDYAHNDYLQILSEIGIIGFLAGVILAGRLVTSAIRRALYARSADERFLMIGCIGSLTAMLLHSFVDFNLYVPANGAVFAWICGIAASGIFVPQRSTIRVKHESPIAVSC